ncbi:MAG: lasso peptide biosynthesis B2 protein [Polaromonas sp.]|nr:lasso peptide biosynthesis B2 protein [Polaromonas sp.]
MTTRPSRITQFHALSAMQQRTLLMAWMGLPLFWLGLRVLGLLRFQDRLLKTPAKSARALALADIRALGEAVNIAARHTPFPAACLTRSLLLGWLLQRQGVKSELRIGVRLTQGSLDAHAWVECEGIPVNDRHDVSAQFASFGDLIPLKAFQTP